MKVIKREFKKMNIALFVIYILLCIISISWYIYDNNINYKNKKCILPEQTVNNNIAIDININKNNDIIQCDLITKCSVIKTNETFLLSNNYNTTKYKLINNITIKIPNTYYFIGDSNTCPQYWELPGYKSNYNKCNDIGYGCCEIPFDINCDYVINNNNNIDKSSYLYNKFSKENKDKFLNIAKQDTIGSNCPTIDDLMCLDFKSDIYPCIIYSIISELFIAILITVCNINNNIFYKKVEYDYEVIDEP